MSAIIRVNIITAGGSGSIVWGDIVQPVFPAIRGTCRGLGLLNARRRTGATRQCL